MGNKKIGKMLTTAALLTLFAAALLAFIPTPTMAQAYTSTAWVFQVYDNRMLPIQKHSTDVWEIEACLYNATWDPKYDLDGDGVLDFLEWQPIKASRDIIENDTGTFVRFTELPDTWNMSQRAGVNLTYVLIIRWVNPAGETTPIVLMNATVRSIPYFCGNSSTLVSLGKLPWSTAAHPQDGVSLGTNVGEWAPFVAATGQGIGCGPGCPCGAPTDKYINYYDTAFRLWLYWIAVEIDDEFGFPLTKAQVEVYYTSKLGVGDGWTYTTTACTIYNDSAVVNELMWRGETNGTYEPPTNGILGEPPMLDKDERYGWIELRLPRIGSNITKVNASLVNYTIVVIKYHCTIVGALNITYLNWSEAVNLDWLDVSYTPNKVANATLDEDIAVCEWFWDNATNVGLNTLKLSRINTTYIFWVSVRWAWILTWDQAGEGWPSVEAEIRVTDTCCQPAWPWPGQHVGVVDDVSGNFVNDPIADVTPGSCGDETFWADTYPAAKLLRYPHVNTTLKLEVKWYDMTVNVTFFNPRDETVWPLADEVITNLTARADKTYVVGMGDWFSLNTTMPVFNVTTMMVQTAIKVLDRKQVYGFLNPDFVDEVIIKFESIETNPVYIQTRLTENGRFIILPDAPAFYVGYHPLMELKAGIGWLPNGSVTRIDVELWFKGVKVIDTITGYPVNSTFSLDCIDPDIRDCDTWLDFGHIQHLYAAVYDVAFQFKFDVCGTLEDAPYGLPVIVTNPAGDKEVLMVDHGGMLTLNQWPAGTWSGFVAVYKGLPMTPNATEITVDENTKPPMTLVYKVYNLEIAVFNFEKNFTIVGVNTQLWHVVDYSKYGITNYILRRVLDNPAKQEQVLPTGWSWNWTESYAVEHLDEYPVVWVRSDVAATGTGGVVTWEWLPGPLVYYLRVWVPEDWHDAVNLGFRPADANATIFWSLDECLPDGMYGAEKGAINLTSCLTDTQRIEVASYVYNVPVRTVDAAGQKLEVEYGSVILAEPYDLDYAPDWQLWWMQQKDPTFLYHGANYNAYLTRRNDSDTYPYVFTSVNATDVNPPYDPMLKQVASLYPNQSRYLIGESIHNENWMGISFPSSSPEYRFNVYWQGILVFNESVPFVNPYCLVDEATALDKAKVSQGVDVGVDLTRTDLTTLKTSVYEYHFRITNTPGCGGETFGIPNIKVEVYWAGLNVTWWPTVNLTYYTAAEEFALLNASKLCKNFNMTVLKRLWGPPQTNPVILAQIPYTKVIPYYSAGYYMWTGVTDSNGEFTLKVPVWNYSVGVLPTFLMGDQGNVSCGPRHPWNASTATINLVYRETGLFGTPLYVNYTTIPGVTNNVPADIDPIRVGFAPAYERWADTHDPNGHFMVAANATGLVNPDTVGDWQTGVSLTMNPDARFDGVGVLVTDGVYGDFQGREGVSPPTSVDNFYAMFTTPTIANDLEVCVIDYLGYPLPDQYVEVIVYYPTTPEPTPELLFSAYTAEDGCVCLRSTPDNILWGFYDVVVRTTNVTKGLPLFESLLAPGTREMPDITPSEAAQIAAENLDEYNSLELFEIQWIVEELEGNPVEDWSTGTITLQWRAQLVIWVLTPDGTQPVEDAWVTVTYGSTDRETEGSPCQPDEPWYKVLLDDWNASYPLPSGVIPWGMWKVDIDSTHAVTACKTDAQGKVKFDLYDDVYVVKVYYKVGGCPEPYEIDALLVYDSFRDETLTRRFVYLGTNTPAWFGGGISTACVQDYHVENARIYDLTLIVKDQSPEYRPLEGVEITLTPQTKTLKGHDQMPLYGTTTLSGAVTFELLPGGSYSIEGTWSGSSVLLKDITLEGTTELEVYAKVYDAWIQIVLPDGTPLAYTPVEVAGIGTLETDSDGTIYLKQLIEGTYHLTVTEWKGITYTPAILDTSVEISASRTYTVEVTNAGRLVVKVVGGTKQGLPGAEVAVMKDSVVVARGVTGADGTWSVMLPSATYTVTVDYKGFTGEKSASVPTNGGEVVVELSTDVFIELFGVAMTFSQFILWIVVAIIIILVLAIIIHEYHVWRRKRMPQLFGATRPTKP